MILHEMICTTGGGDKFTIGNRKIVWELACYNKNGKISIMRVLDINDKGGKPWIMGLRFKSSIANPNSIVKLVDCKPPYHL